ncbi:M1 family metallopeptidase [Robertkochia solimangrovi]|uniref:M1 family metallopeptidase n=1 Tax=Robertkochia solimangrovi TaxID=2213046 RepID=UPI0011808529|nr:M1 family metallopeptidase [Robertkochia solimangrovi]TRZ46076.1 M1 family peptidase [Robertkochia solimangrovi]
MKKIFFTILGLGTLFGAMAGNPATERDNYWQQHVSYKMDVNMDVETFRYEGTQNLKYTNNSPDTLKAVYYHLYFNAFQPGSEMDVRSRTISDPDRRVKDRISLLNPDEIGYLKVSSLKKDGKKLDYHTEGTVLEVALDKPILPGETVEFDMEFNGQVPQQIRRSGRNNAEGVALSMTQWYPKMAEYDFEGWQAHPYIAREFQGVWGDFDVKITLDKDYTIGGTGYLQNPNEIGHGYEKAGSKVKQPRGKTLTWHFIAPNVHDFAWVADPEFVHDTYPMENGPTLHFFYKNKPELKDNWKQLQPKTAAMIDFYGAHVGKYPYEQYSVIQGGDGGMEYAMCTLITGERKLGSLIGVTAHELAHSWFQHILASNESKNEWMDEGFTSYISDLCMDAIMDSKADNPFKGAYRGYFALVKSGMEQPQTTQADRYATNFAYGIAAYSKGEIFLSQLGYVIGEADLAKTLRRYFDTFKFTHPTPNDIKRTAERVSGMSLDWYLTDWTQTTNTIDYGIKAVAADGDKTTVTLERIGLMPMPVDVVVHYKDGSSEYFYAPLRMMRGEKPNPYDMKRTVLPDWAWAYPEYGFSINKAKSEISSIEIDPSQLMADINRENNTFKADQAN